MSSVLLKLSLRSVVFGGFVKQRFVVNKFSDFLRSHPKQCSTMACKMFLEFSNGLKMPQLGLGTWQAPEAEVEAALNEALRAGYRHIDCAPVYQNEHVIGRVLKEWLDAGKVQRDELFITTKLPPFGNRPGSVETCLRKSLNDLQLDYVDLYLVHTPFTLAEPTATGFQLDADGNVVLDLSTDHIATWRVMEEMLAAGLTKSIGVSNFNQQQLQRLLNNCKVKPVNLQVESHVYLQQEELTNFCKANNVTVTAYSPLGSQGIANILKSVGVEREIPDLMENPVVKEIASKHNKTPAQVLLRHILDRGLAPIPKSTNFQRLKQNMDVFDFQLDTDDMEAMAKLDQGVRVCDFAFFKGVTKHPEFPF